LFQYRVHHVAESSQHGVLIPIELVLKLDRNQDSTCIVVQIFSAFDFPQARPPITWLVRRRCFPLPIAIWRAAPSDGMRVSRQFDSETIQFPDTR
jgi:hypothetical protein